MSDDYAGSPINMYKRERHDTSSSVNANLYVSKVEDTRAMHYRCTIVDWKGNNDKIFDRSIAIDKRKRYFSFSFLFEMKKKSCEIVRIRSDPWTNCFQLFYVMRFTFD